MSLRFANPVYDSVFKHLMQNTGIARGILERLLDASIESLEIRQHEHSFISQGSVDSADGSDPRTVSLHIYRIDFCATIALGNGQGNRRVIIELQKSHLLSDVVRFRRYLGQAYSMESTQHEDTLARVRKQNETRPEDDQLPLPPPPEALPVIPVFLLDFIVGRDLPRVVRVGRNFRDGVTGQPIRLSQPNPFIETLTHDAVLVQFPQTPRPLGEDEQETLLERLLHVFERRFRFSREERWFIDGQAVEAEAGDDPLVRAILRELSRVANDTETMQRMSAEDEVLRLLEAKDGALRVAEHRARAAEEHVRVVEERAETAEEHARAAEERANREHREKIAAVERANQEHREKIAAVENAHAAEENARAAEERARAVEENARAAEERAQSAELELARLKAALAAGNQ